MTDPNNNVTSWTYDVQGRPVSKKYADNSTVIIHTKIRQAD